MSNADSSHMKETISHGLSSFSGGSATRLLPASADDMEAGAAGTSSTGTDDSGVATLDDGASGGVATGQSAAIKTASDDSVEPGEPTESSASISASQSNLRTRGSTASQLPTCSPAFEGAFPRPATSSPGFSIAS